jgi:sulfur carrier protein ThiS
MQNHDGSISVRILRTDSNGQPSEVHVEEGTTVADLASHGFDLEGLLVRVNGTRTEDFARPLSDGDSILATPTGVKGAAA